MGDTIRPFIRQFLYPEFVALNGQIEENTT
jgi:hypothetical protein